MFYLYDLFPEQKGAKRFEITCSRLEGKRLICIDKSKRKIQESLELLLNDWEGSKEPVKGFTPSKPPFVCVTRQSSDGVTTYREPWYQIQAEVERRGEVFIK